MTACAAVGPLGEHCVEHGGDPGYERHFSQWVTVPSGGQGRASWRIEVTEVDLGSWSGS